MNEGMKIVIYLPPWTEEGEGYYRPYDDPSQGAIQNTGTWNSSMTAVLFADPSGPHPQWYDIPPHIMKQIQQMADRFFGVDFFEKKWNAMYHSPVTFYVTRDLHKNGFHTGQKAPAYTVGFSMGPDLEDPTKHGPDERKGILLPHYFVQATFFTGNEQE